jgi:iron complex transport system ATP-binding protein
MRIKHTTNSIVVTFSNSRAILSSAPYFGGLYTTNTIVNLKTNAKEMHHHPPDKFILQFLKKNHLNEKSVGFLTAAHLEFAQFIHVEDKECKILAIITAGTSNALNAAEKSLTPYTGESLTSPGTINIIAITNADLSVDGFVSSVITATEAKSAALFDLRVRSTVTGNQATGTGTDAVAIVGGKGMRIQYAGGHTQFGQLLGEAVYTGVKKSLLKERNQVKLTGLCRELVL